MSIPPKFTSISNSHTVTRIRSGGCFLMSASKIPARDRLITFGKYKGKMLGSLPSSYLRWVSKNLRAGDTQEWAKLADEVLVDSVYRDRVEWELAENVLNGNNVGSSSSGHTSVSVLLEMSERFGWDNDDKVGWSKIDFGLLGTSKGSRIPRTSVEQDKESVKSGGGGRRRTRVSRPPLQTETGGGGKLGKGSGNEQKPCVGDEDAYRVMPVANPFPGREALLDKVRKTFRRV
ncbi:uncharacterized protein LOC142554560 [Primulina tabacum]|uniref:uncharacterized protein LOC142554560 n=1 Tax=Primulina tabacum TaxID=48773 RepID=UPI003F5ADD45